MRDPSIIAAQRQRIPSEDFLHGVNAGRTATPVLLLFRLRLSPKSRRRRLLIRRWLLVAVE
jgi:hypothetical protein